VEVATHESESDRARVRFSNLLMCADFYRSPIYESAEH